MSQQNDATPVVSRIRFAACVLLAVGGLSLTIANAFGDVSLRLTMKSILAATFILGGGLLGLLVACHVAQTHLPDSADDDFDNAPESADEQQAMRELRRSRGFLALFTLSRESESNKAGRTDNPLRRPV
jgi:hypothetical protein